MSQAVDYFSDDFRMEFDNEPEVLEVKATPVRKIAAKIFWLLMIGIVWASLLLVVISTVYIIIHGLYVMIDNPCTFGQGPSNSCDLP